MTAVLAGGGGAAATVGALLVVPAAMIGLSLEVQRQTGSSGMVCAEDPTICVELDLLEDAAANEILTFHRGTYYYDALEVVQNRGFDAKRIAAVQSNVSHAPGVYLTTQPSTARYYGNLAGGQGRGGGPAMLTITIVRSSFDALARQFGIPFETMVERPPTPGQTETRIPLAAISEFNSIITTISVDSQ